MPFLTLDNVNLWYDQRGEGPDLVWVPGGDQVIEHWKDQIEAFGDDYRNTCFDPRGSGRTSASDISNLSIRDMSGDCAALIEKVCNPPVVVIGVSMGGYVALQLALDCPELVKAAVIMAGSAKPSGFSRSWMEAEIDHWKNHGGLSPKFAKHHYGVFYYPPEVMNNPEEWERLSEVIEAAYTNRDSESLCAQWEACLAFDVLDELPDCSVPIHAIGFGCDVASPPALSKEIADTAANGTFHLVEGLGHLSLMGHEPDIVNKLIREIITTFR